MHQGPANIVAKLKVRVRPGVVGGVCVDGGGSGWSWGVWQWRGDVRASEGVCTGGGEVGVDLCGCVRAEGGLTCVEREG